MTERLVMSAEINETNETPKKSFLTRAMENVRAKKNADGTDEHADHPAIIADKKKFAKIAVAGVVGTAAVIAVAWTTLSKFAPVEEETSEENSTDSETTED